MLTIMVDDPRTIDAIERRAERVNAILVTLCNTVESIHTAEYQTAIDYLKLAVESLEALADTKRRVEYPTDGWKDFAIHTVRLEKPYGRVLSKADRVTEALKKLKKDNPTEVLAIMAEFERRTKQELSPTT
jgi:hypothetical protein